MKKKDCYVYELKDSNKVVYYGISNDPDRRVIEHENSDKRFTHINILKGPMYKENADIEETTLIFFYQESHEGKPPRHNEKKTALHPYLQKSFGRKKIF
jgi:hypothetical protein